MPRAPAVRRSTETQLGPHSAQKFVILPIVDHSSIRSDKAHNIALVLTVEQNMTREPQEITAKAAAHRTVHRALLLPLDNFRVHVTEPVRFLDATDEDRGARNESE